MEAERKAQRELDEAVYDILGLTKEERRQVEEGLKELQELRRARTKPSTASNVKLNAKIRF
ncbi:MAG: hypothetical protein QXO54_05875 [Candidatus Methanomethylicaceae archaeon]|nr:hypothetical protein [Candidatus Verstraetearchaeota archaeon]